MRRLILLIVSLTIVAADGVMLHFGRRYLTAESRHIQEARIDGARRAARAAATESVGAALDELLARENARHWREYTHLYVPPDAIGNNFVLNPSPIRDLQDNGLVRTRLTVDATGALGSPWIEPETATIYQVLGEDLTPDDPEVGAEKQQRLAACEFVLPGLIREAKRSVPQADVLHDGLTPQVLMTCVTSLPAANELLQAKQGSKFAQDNLDQAWNTQQEINRVVRKVKGAWGRDQQQRGQSAAQTSEPQQTMVPRQVAEDQASMPQSGQTQSLLPGQGSYGEPEADVELQNVDASSVYLGRLAAVRVPDPESVGGQAIFYLRAVRVTPWRQTAAPPAFQGFQLDVDRVLALAREALARQGLERARILPLTQAMAQVSGGDDGVVSVPAPLEHLAIVAPVPPAPDDPFGSTRALLYGAAALICVLGTAGLKGVDSVLESRTELARRRTDFVAAVSHELKAPLAGIRALAEMLDAGMVKDEARRGEYVAHILHESERLSRIIANVLDLAKIERSERTYDVRPNDPSRLVREAAQSFRGHTEREGMKLELTMPESLPPVAIDSDALVQALCNLIDNACKYAGKAASLETAGEEPPQVSVSAQEVEGGVLIEVADSGPGIPATETASIFEPFYRGERHLVGSAGGAGLGLAIARTHVRAMGGRLDLDLTRDRGACFRVFLRAPAAPARPEDRPMT